MTLFQHMLQLCGLTNREAALFFGEEPRTVRAWSLDQEDVPPEAWDMLAGLYRQIEECADEAVYLLSKEGVNPLDHHAGISITCKGDSMPKGAAAVAGAITTARMLREAPSYCEALGIIGKPTAQESAERAQRP